MTSFHVMITYWCEMFLLLVILFAVCLNNYTTLFCLGVTRFVTTVSYREARPATVSLYHIGRPVRITITCYQRVSISISKFYILLIIFIN